MNTAEMWINAQKDGCTYECPNEELLYSKKVGLVENDAFNEPVHPSQFESWEYTFDKLMSFEWKRADGYMTIKEAEEKYGIKIIRESD